jgi:curved DNA-binding protein CbpA
MRGVEAKMALIVPMTAAASLAAISAVPANPAWVAHGASGRRQRGALSRRRAHALAVRHCDGGPPDGLAKKTLYDLLGACPGDDANELKKAFRRAVKASHPDLHPDDPDAPIRLSGVVRAYAILRDPRERTAYDAALEFERESLRRRPKRSVGAALRNVISEAVAVAVLAIVLSGGFALLARMPEGDGGNAVSVTAREPKFVAVQPAPPTSIIVREDPQSGPALPTSPNVTLSAALSGSKEAPAMADDMSSLPTKEVVEPADHSGRLTDQALAKTIDDWFVARHEPVSPDQRQNPNRMPNAAPSARLSSLPNENAAKSSSPDHVATDQKHRPEDARSPDAKAPKSSAHEKPRAVATGQTPSRPPVKQASIESRSTPACSESQSCSGKSLVLRGVGP